MRGAPAWGIFLSSAVLASACLGELSPTQSSAPATAPAARLSTVPAATSTGPGAGAAICAGKDTKAHVYHPDRLVVRDACRTVTGVVTLLRREPDGDYHVRLRLDPGQEGLVNARNLSEQEGALVLEIVCANPVTQADAVSVCASYTNPVPIPTVGERVSVTGPYVLDLDHGWMEIHPVWDLSPLGAIPPLR